MNEPTQEPSSLLAVPSPEKTQAEVLMEVFNDPAQPGEVRLRAWEQYEGLKWSEFLAAHPDYKRHELTYDESRFLRSFENKKPLDIPKKK